MNCRPIALFASGLALSGLFYLPPSVMVPCQARQDSHHASVNAAPAVTEERINGRNYQVTRMVVKVRPEHVWQVLTDYNAAAGIFPTVKKSQMVADKGNIKVLHHEIKPTGVLKSFQYQLEIRETAHKMLQWKRLSGDFKEVDGFWKLEPMDGGRSTHVTYATYVDGGFFCPQPLIKRQFRVDMPAVMVALKNHAETTSHIATGRTGMGSTH